MIEKRIAVTLSALVVMAAVAAAEPAPARRDSLKVIIGSDVGLDLAGGLQLETSWGLRLTGTLGWLPRFYAWGFKKYYETVYDGSDAVGEVLEDTLANALVVRTNLGLRPFASRGLFMAVGYTLQANSVDDLLASELEDATGDRLPGVGNGPRRFETKIRNHLIDATVGWQWGLGSGFSLQATVGVLVLVHTRTTFSPLYEPADPTRTRAFIDAAEKRIEDAGVPIVAPEVTVFLGYTF